MNDNLMRKIGSLALLYFVVRIAIPVELSAAAIACPPYAANVHQAIGVVNASAALCEPDDEFASVGIGPGSVLILDMGMDNQLTDELGIDFYYYERPSGA